jgi:hypothetical protein
MADQYTDAPLTPISTPAFVDAPLQPPDFKTENAKDATGHAVVRADPQEARTLSEHEFNTIRDSVLNAAPAGLSQEDFTRWMNPRLAAAMATAEHLPPAAEGSALYRFASNLGEMINPVPMVKGVAQAIAHPIDTATGLLDQHVQQFAKSGDAFRQSRYSEAVGHGAAAVVPILGPYVANTAEQIGEQAGHGDYAGAAGKFVGILAPALAPAAIRTGARAARVLPDAVAEAAEAGAARRITDVMAPKVGANKVRFGGMAEEVAPDVAKDLATEGAPWTREGLQTHVATKLAESEAALDAASDTRLHARTFKTQPLIDDLLKKRGELTAESVDASVAPKPVPGAGPYLRAKLGGGPTGPLGADVVPAPNAPRAAVIDQAIEELRKLGPEARYEPIRRVRQAYDSQAKAVYSPSITADYLKAQGAKLGAADVTGTLRDGLARWDPQTAAANSQYSLYRTANDVLEATAEVERTRPKLGRAIMTRLTTTMAGEQAAAVPGAVAGFVLGPVVDSAMASGITTQLKTARLLTRLASAIRGGQVGPVDHLTRQLKALAPSAAAAVDQATRTLPTPANAKPEPQH